MKKIYLLILSLVFTFNLAAQNNTRPDNKDPKSDIVLKTNGDELTGKVTEIGDSEIKFVYNGETLVYSIKKEEVLKITYASGRIEFFNRQAATTSAEKKEEKIETNSVPEEHHNKVAILPFGFIKDNQSAGDEMGYKVQQDVYTYLGKHSAGLTIVDPRTTNALLIKAGITRENMMGFTMDEICNTLGVEYVLEGTVTQNKGIQTSSSSDQYKTTTSPSNKTNTNNNRTSSGYSSTTTMQTYITTITMNIYTDKNTNIFSENRKGLLASTDGSYSSPLEYLLKRCPLYRK
jgi:TolB-like protein